jgi:hypothetical protein
LPLPLSQMLYKLLSSMKLSYSYFDPSDYYTSIIY